MDSNNATYSERTKNGTVFVGGDQDVFRAAMLASSLKLYADTNGRIIPTRGVGITKMLKLASQYTGKKYKRTQATEAAADLKSHVEWLKSQPNTDKPLPRFPA